MRAIVKTGAQFEFNIIIVVMDSNVNVKFSERNISKTAYRAWVLLIELMKGPLSKEQIYELFSKDVILRKGSSHDTIRVTVNTLRATGCEIQRPSSSVDFKYVLKNSPFGINLTPAQFDVLNSIRGNLTQFGDWRFILELNDFYEKIANYSTLKDAQQMLSEKNPFRNIDLKILKLLDKASQKKYSLKIEYNSPKNGPEFIDIVADNIVFDAGRLYLWGNNLKNNDYICLNIERVKSIVSTNLIKTEASKKTFKVRYKLTGEEISLFKKTGNLEIIETSHNHLVIEEEFKNEFNFLQKVLSYGKNCTVISPEKYRKKVIDKLLQIKEVYECPKSI